MHIVTPTTTDGSHDIRCNIKRRFSQKVPDDTCGYRTKVWGRTQTTVRYAAYTQPGIAQTNVSDKSIKF